MAEPDVCRELQKLRTEAKAAKNWGRVFSALISAVLLLTIFVWSDVASKVKDNQHAIEKHKKETSEKIENNATAIAQFQGMAPERATRLTAFEESVSDLDKKISELTRSLKSDINEIQRDIKSILRSQLLLRPERGEKP